jgi:hypothetical protein
MYSSAAKTAPNVDVSCTIIRSRQFLFVESSRREADFAEPGIEVGVTKRAFSSQVAPLANAFDAIGVRAHGEDRRSTSLEIFEADRTRLPSNRRPNYLRHELLAVYSPR